MRRKLCQVNGAHGEPAKRAWRAACKVCLVGTKGPPAAVEVGGACAASLRAQADDHVLETEVVQVRLTFSSKNAMEVGVMSLGRMLAASPMRSRWAKLRKARAATRISGAVRARSAMNNRRSAVAQSCGGEGAERSWSERASARWKVQTVEGRRPRVSS